MKTSDSYLMFVRWSDEDAAYVGYCPDLFPAGGVCHADSKIEAYSRLIEIVEELVTTAEQQGLALPPCLTRPMPEVELSL